MSLHSQPASGLGLAERRLGAGRPQYWRPQYWRPQYWRPQYWRPQYWRPQYWRPQYRLSAASGCAGNLAYMQPGQGQPVSPNGHLDAPGPAVEGHGRVVSTSLRAASWYRQAQRAVDRRRATEALRLAVEADPAFELALADLDAITGTSARSHIRRQMNWERHHIEVVRTAVIGDGTRAADLLREHLADVGCDPLASRIVAHLRQPGGMGDDVENVAGQLRGCHATQWPSGWSLP